MSIIAKITLNQSVFSTNEQKIANYILANPSQAANFSSQQLAKALSVSQSSIVKFVQKLGFKGFVAFKLSLSQEIGRKAAITSSVSGTTNEARLHNLITQEDELPSIIKKLLQEKNQAATETSNAFDINIIEAVISKIDQSKVIQIVGIGGSALVAKDLANKLLKIGYTVICETDSHTQLTIAQTLTADDLQIVISFSGRRKEVILAAELAKKCGSVVVGVTSLEDSPLRAIADYTLTTIADEQLRSSSISSRTAQHTVTDLLFMALLQKRDQKGKRLIDNAQKVIQTLLSH